MDTRRKLTPDESSLLERSTEGAGSSSPFIFAEVLIHGLQFEHDLCLLFDLDLLLDHPPFGNFVGNPSSLEVGLNVSLDDVVAWRDVPQAIDTVFVVLCFMIGQCIQIRTVDGNTEPMLIRALGLP
jgi:hypothetical protein